ncbi:antitoxin [Schaalia turicensis]
MNLDDLKGKAEELKDQATDAAKGMMTEENTDGILDKVADAAKTATGARDVVDDKIGE